MGDGGGREALNRELLGRTVGEEQDDGENACPPEDCGGPAGYAEILLALESPDDPAFRERLEWLDPSFRPTTFDVRATNRILQLAHRRKRAV